MNAPIMRLYVLVLVLFATLVGFTSYWAVFKQEELQEKPDNRRTLIEAQGIKLDVTPRKVPGTEITIAFITDPWGTSIELSEGLDKLP